MNNLKTPVESPFYDFPSKLISAACVFALLLACSAKSAARALAQYRSAAGLVIAIFSAAWSLNAMPDEGLLAGMSYHLLAANLAALMIGIPAALWLGALVMIPYIWLFGDWQAYPLNTLAVLLPSLLVNFAAQQLVNRLPDNIFIFIFVNGFLASAAAMLASGAIIIGLLDWTDAFSDGILWETAFPVFFLIAWAEAFLSGITTAIFIALRPYWLNAFDDNRYLKRRNTIW